MGANNILKEILVLIMVMELVCGTIYLYTTFFYTIPYSDLRVYVYGMFFGFALVHIMFGIALGLIIKNLDEHENRE